MLLTVESAEDSVVEIHLDSEGRDLLVKALSRLKQGDHDHLMTPSRGGDVLTEEKMNVESMLVNHLYPRLWPIKDSSN
jgi:hypothetical protein